MGFFSCLSEAGPLKKPMSWCCRVAHGAPPLVGESLQLRSARGGSVTCCQGVAAGRPPMLRGTAVFPWHTVMPSWKDGSDIGMSCQSLAKRKTDFQLGFLSQVLPLHLTDLPPHTGKLPGCELAAQKSNCFPGLMNYGHDIQCL